MPTESSKYQLQSVVLQGSSIHVSLNDLVDQPKAITRQATATRKAKL